MPYFNFLKYLSLVQNKSISGALLSVYLSVCLPNTTFFSDACQLGQVNLFILGSYTHGEFSELTMKAPPPTPLILGVLYEVPIKALCGDHIHPSLCGLLSVTKLFFRLS